MDRLLFSQQKERNGMNEYRTQDNLLIKNYKDYYDCLYGMIDFENTIWKIIDTEEYQRLRNLRQLGVTHLIFSGANHTRFEHCVGTAHLSRKMYNKLIKNSSNEMLDLDNNEIKRYEKLITIGGLCHDIGHGPFSHAFDSVVDKLLGQHNDDKRGWNHEWMGTQILDSMYQKYDLDLEQEDITFINNVIMGSNPNQNHKYDYLYQIVANNVNSIDTDKLDYINRDCMHVGLKGLHFDNTLIIKNCKVINDDICYPSKYACNLYDLFSIRYKLYKQIYQHRVSQGIELMIHESILNCSHKLDLYESIFDVEKYNQLDDNIIHRIDYIQNQDNDVYVHKSQSLLKRIKQRDIYKYVSECLMDKTVFQNKYWNQDHKVKTDIVSNVKNNTGVDRIEIKDIYVVYGHTNYGFKDKNPVDRVKFYEKYHQDTNFYLEKEQISQLLPCKFYEKFIRIFVDGNTQKIQKVRDAFYRYCQSEGLMQGQQKYYNDYDSQPQPDSLSIQIQNQGQKSFSEYLTQDTIMKKPKV